MKSKRTAAKKPKRAIAAKKRKPAKKKELSFEPIKTYEALFGVFEDGATIIISYEVDGKRKEEVFSKSNPPPLWFACPFRPNKLGGISVLEELEGIILLGQFQEASGERISPIITNTQCNNDGEPCCFRWFAIEIKGNLKTLRKS
jgi:hypothetical protein